MWDDIRVVEDQRDPLAGGHLQLPLRKLQAGRGLNAHLPARRPLLPFHRLRTAGRDGGGILDRQRNLRDFPVPGKFGQGGTQTMQGEIEIDWTGGQIGRVQMQRVGRLQLGNLDKNRAAVPQAVDPRHFQPVVPRLSGLAS